MARDDTFVVLRFVDVARGRRDRMPKMGKDRTMYILGEMEWAVRSVNENRCPVCGRGFRSAFNLKSHLVRSPCGRAIKDEIHSLSNAFRRHRVRRDAWPVCMDGGGGEV